MIKIVGVRFQRAGKIYYFDPGDLDLDMAMHVVVETARGLEMGTVLIPPKDVEEDTIVSPLKSVIRVATDEDEAMLAFNKGREKDAFAICKKKILEHELEMKLVAAEYTFDGSKLLFYFTADGRIDFRELVKDLASVFRTRIELRQIGVRDETKMMSGIGICGRPLCCSTWLADFVPVTIKMAKEQNLSLNPTKISGVCGRLMCCLKNEQETYEYLNSRLPNVGETIQMSDGARGVVNSVNVLRQTVKIIVDNGEEKELKEYSVNDMGTHAHHRKDTRLTAEEQKAMEELASLEDGDAKTEGGRENRRNNRDRKNNRDKRENREERGNREGREERGNREYRENRNENREGREERGNREYRENRNENREGREERGNREYRENRNENREGRENREERRNREYRENRGENREERGNREDRENRGERRNFRDRRENREGRENGENRDDRRGRDEEGGFRRRRGGRGHQNNSGEGSGQDE